MSVKQNPTAPATPSKPGSSSPIVFPSSFARSSARSKARHSSGTKTPRGVGRADQRRANKCQPSPAASAASTTAMRTRPAVISPWMGTPPPEVSRMKQDGVSLVTPVGVYHHPHYRHPSSSEPASPLLRAAAATRPTPATTQQRGAKASRHGQPHHPPQRQQQDLQRWRAATNDQHLGFDVKSDASGRCAGNKKESVHAAPKAGAADENHRYGQQPRHPKESAPASSHPASLEDLDLPFQVGEFVVDPETHIHYQLKKLLGRGAYALVWQALRTTDNALVALKALSTKSLTPEQRELQRLEARLHAEAYAHSPSSVVPFLATWVQPDDHWVWICLGNCNNGDLYTWLTDGPGSSSHLGPHLRSKFWIEILTATQQIHEIGIGHRDLKPENFLISTKNSIMLTDFGLATKEALSTDWECGSRPYMAPEVCEKTRLKLAAEGEDPSLAEPEKPEPYDPRASDVWSLGVVYLNLHHLCSAWSSPDGSCRTFHHFVKNPDTWLEDAGVESRQMREWLMTKVFVRPSQRCSVAEWLQFERSRKPPTGTRPRSALNPGTPERVTVSISEGIAVPTARVPAAAASDTTHVRLAVSAPAETPRKPGGKVVARDKTPASLEAPTDPSSLPTGPSSRPTAIKGGHRRRPSWAFDLDFDEPDGKVEFSPLSIFAIEDVSDDESHGADDPFVVRSRTKASPAAGQTKASP